MKKGIIYIHGKGGTAEEAQHYVPLFPAYDVIGFGYQAETPWEAEKEFAEFFDQVAETHESVSVIANSIGACFALYALNRKPIEQAWLISPIVNMKQLIEDMLGWAGCDPAELEEKGTIETSFGETLSWEYYSWVLNHPVVWTHPTRILYGAADTMQSFETIQSFARRVRAEVTVDEDGEHWFHTDAQMAFLDAWITAEKEPVGMRMDLHDVRKQVL